MKKQKLFEIAEVIAFIILILSIGFIMMVIGAFMTNYINLILFALLFSGGIAILGWDTLWINKHFVDGQWLSDKKGKEDEY